MTDDIRQLITNQDAFDNQIGVRTNVLDVAAHYPFSPERWRFFKNGSRQFIQYNSVSEYNHNKDVHELSPSGGDTVTLETAERPRYVVQYELASTWAFSVNQSLNDGDILKIGLYDGSNGWYMEHKGSKHADDEADFVNERGGTEKYRKESINIKKAVTNFSRLRLKTGWYNITRQKWDRSYSDNGKQRNEPIGEFSLDDDRGPEVGNLPLHYEVTADANTSNLTLNAGSCAQVNLGKTTSLTRNKVAVETVTLGTSGTWAPLFALRTDPDRDIINTQLSDVAITEFDTSADIRVAAQAFDPSKVLDSNGNELTDSDFSTPEIFNNQNNVIQVSTAVAQFPDSTGSVGTTADNPGGWQVGFDSLFTGGGNSVSENTAGQFRSKRPIYGQDTIVFLANAGGTGDVSVQFRAEEDW